MTSKLIERALHGWPEDEYHPMTSPNVHARQQLTDTCAYCGTKDQLTKDHFIPRSKGGPKGQQNIVIACFSCNQHKGDREFASLNTARNFIRFRQLLNKMATDIESLRRKNNEAKINDLKCNLKQLRRHADSFF